jgi:drug/metabolite transporter (DMT)-like permease
MNPTYAVLYGELILSLYPILIKTVDTNIFTQVLARFIAFPVIALLFGSFSDFSSIWNTKNAFSGIMYNIINLGHIAASYIAFKNLPISTAISLFYLYPIFNVIAGSFMGEPLSFISIMLIMVSFFGTYLIATSYKNENKVKWYGIVMGIIAALTETIIFISVRSTNASPYHTIHNLYPAGLVALLLYAIFNKNIVDTSSINWVTLLGFNALLGFTGYFARFYAIPKIPIILFSLLSFFGVSFGYLWGHLFTDDVVTIKALVGSVLIASSAALIRYRN